MDLLAAQRSALRQFDNRVQLIRDDQWRNATPNTEWDVTELVRHLVYEQLWVPPLLAGRSIAEVGDAFEGDILGDDPKGAWTAASTAARDALEQPGALDREVNLSFGDTTAADYLSQLTVDLVVHAWDLASGIKADEHMPNDLVTTSLELARPIAGIWADAGFLAPPIQVPGCTDDLTELLALMGRSR